MWLTGASHVLWLTPESLLGSEHDSSPWKGGKYWINSNYSVGRWMKSELGCYKGTKADISKSFSRHYCDDSVHTHGGSISHLSCSLWWPPNTSPHTFDSLSLLTKARQFHNLILDIKWGLEFWPVRLTYFMYFKLYSSLSHQSYPRRR